MSPMLIIAKREFRSYFDSPLAYVVICLSFLVLGAFFFLVSGGFWQVDRATVSRLFELSPYGLAFLVVPVITMRLISEEKRSGTLEMLITLPVKDSDVILGKYLGALGMLLVLVLATAIYPLVMFKWPWNLGPLDTGPVLAGYFGLILFCAAATAIGLLLSSLTESQAIAFFVTVFVLLGLWLTGMFARWLGGTAGNILNFIAFDARLSGFSRGLIDTRDVVYFVTVTAVCLVMAFRALERRKWA
ncbi:MAG TPA: ABC transporter permease subunit [Polyangiaceae bacterium]|nr:ABC transporter permease subunit [Polyangiaceae bacterium]